MRNRWPLTLRPADVGAASLDYIGAILIAAVICGLVAAGIAPVQVSQAFRHAVCTILQVVSADCDPEPVGTADADFKPQSCKIREDAEKGGTEVKLGWFKIGEDFGFIRQEFSDGTVRLTLVDSASIGAVGSGKEKLFDIGKLGDKAKGGASVEVAAGLKFGYGDTWQFTDAAQERKFRGEIEKYALQQQQLQHASSPGGAAGIALWNSLTNNWADPPDPTITFAKGSLEASAKGSLGLKIPTGPADAKGKIPTADPNLGGSLTLKGEYEVMIEKNATAGTTSWSYQLTPQIKAAGSAVVVGGEIYRKRSGSFKVTRNDKGELVSLSFVSTRDGGDQVSLGLKSPVAAGSAKAKGNGKIGEGESRATVTSTTLTVTNDEERRIAEEWMSGHFEQFSSPLDLTFNTLIPTRPAPPGDEFNQLLYEKAVVSQINYDNVSDVQEFGAEVNLGFKLGFSFTLENSSSTVGDATYLGAPGADGDRPMVDFAECS
jgi:hypothetical protein